MPVRAVSLQNHGEKGTNGNTPEREKVAYFLSMGQGALLFLRVDTEKGPSGLAGAFLCRVEAAGWHGEAPEHTETSTCAMEGYGGAAERDRCKRVVLASAAAPQGYCMLCTHRERTQRQTDFFPEPVPILRAARGRAPAGNDIPDCHAAQ